jgi:DNA-directed RNA polymerase specialized sigma24 family protein
MTVRKSLKQARREKAAKRGGGRVIDEAGLAGADGEDDRLAELAAQMPSQEFDLHCEELLGMLDDEMRSFAVLRLLGYRNREIADQFDCTERKVERKLNLIRLKWQQYASE